MHRSVRACLLMVTAWGTTSTAWALCEEPRGSPNIQCVPDHCVVVWDRGGAPASLEHEASGTVVPLDMLPLSGGRLLLRASLPLMAGRHVVIPDGSDVPFVVDVGGLPPGFSSVGATGKYRPVPPVCNDSPGMPAVKRESDFVVSVDLGRAPLPNTRADLWFLFPGDPVPVGAPDMFATAPRAPDMERVFQVLQPAQPCPWCKAEPTFDVALFPAFEGADRVAIQVMETTGERTGVLVVSLDDERGWYVACACARSAPSSVPAGLLLLALASLRRR
jgi:hypothetical protein